MISSAVYCFNDIYDFEVDKIHPKKKMRPIASGKVSKTAGWIIMLVCVTLSFVISLVGEFVFGETGVLLILAAYLVMNILYTIFLKQVPILDVFVVAIGFVLRVEAGGLVTNIRVSHWLVLMTFLLALFLAFAKRRDDVVVFDATGVVPRRSVSHYNLPFMNQVISIIASVTMVCYIMYTVSDEVTGRIQSENLYLTSVFVLAGIIRYLQITIVDVSSGSPTRVLLQDRFIQLCIILWAISFAVILYI